VKRIICHWTAGAHKANSTDIQHYHFVVEGDGKIVIGKYQVWANARPLKRGYAVHTRGCNTDSIGVSMACMGGAKERPLAYGHWPMKRKQWDAFCRLVATLAAQYRIPVTPQTILSHAEVQGTLGIKQRQKWDFTVLPPFPELRGAKACGDKLRNDVAKAIQTRSVK
jgi:N-acetyl-anhydromuramyl-L-alanine amidase AmpD